MATEPVHTQPAARLAARLLRIRWFARAPIWMFRARLGFLTGSRLLMLEHIGRTTGARRYVVLEVVDQPSPGNYVVASGFGERAQWFRNIRANKAVRICVGSHAPRPATAEILGPVDAKAALDAFAQEHPRAWRAVRPLFEATLAAAGSETPTTLPLVSLEPLAEEDETWLRDARRARALSWASLAWMTVEGVVGLIAGLDANSLSVLVWAASSFVEGLAAMIVIWRFTSARTMSERSERTAQRLVAGSFLLLVPFVLYEAARRLIDGSHAAGSALGIAVTASAIVLMPALGRAKLRLGERLGSGATAGEGVQNLLCALQAAAALIALIGASAGLSAIDPIAALVVVALAIRESLTLWQGDCDDCCAPVGFGNPISSSGGRDGGCECCRPTQEAPGL